MLRKTVLISCIVLLSASLAVFSEQSGEQKPKDIEQQLKEAMCLRNAGIATTSVGIALAFVGGYFFLEFLASIGGSSYLDTSSAFRLWIITDLIGGACVVVGPILWSRGARQIRNIRKSQVALQLLGPDWVEGKSLGGISLGYRY